jgi:hypothetical protein
MMPASHSCFKLLICCNGYFKTISIWGTMVRKSKATVTVLVAFIALATGYDMVTTSVNWP